MHEKTANILYYYINLNDKCSLYATGIQDAWSKMHISRSKHWKLFN
jgi:hypothetical protein